MKRPVLLTLAGFAIAAFGIALACGTNSITVATIVADAGRPKCVISDGGDGGCPPGQFCSRSSSCGSNVGQCLIIDSDGSDGCTISGPECGCDGISYFNSCVRQMAGISRSAPGQCEGVMNVTPKRCGETGCPTEKASCATILPGPGGFSRMFADAAVALVPDGASFNPLDAAPLDPGVCREISNYFEHQGQLCWVLPSDGCHSPGAQAVSGLCNPKCVDECAAIRDGGVYILCSTN